MALAVSGGRALVVPPEAAGTRLDRFLAERIPEATRSALRRLIDEGRVFVDDRPAPKAGLALEPGMVLSVDLPAPAPPALLPEDLPLAIVHEDEEIIVVDKAPGMVVHPGHGCRTGTLVHALLGRGIALAAAGGADRPGIVHRLDRGTSGLIVVARTDRAHRALAAAFAGRQVRKTYQAIVWGRPDPPSGRIDRPIGRSRRDPTRMAVGGRGGREAATTYRTVEAFPGFARLEIGLLTGRTHQIRVHLQAIHHPIVGDERYAGRPWRGVQDPRRRNALREFPRPALHASDLAFEHPATGEAVAFHAPIPADMQDLLAVLRATS